MSRTMSKTTVSHKNRSDWRKVTMLTAAALSQAAVIALAVLVPAEKTNKSAMAAAILLGGFIVPGAIVASGELD